MLSTGAISWLHTQVAREPHRGSHPCGTTGLAISGLSSAGGLGKVSVGQLAGHLMSGSMTYAKPMLP